MIIRILILLLGTAISAWAQLPSAGSPDVYWRINPGTSVSEVSIRQAGADQQATIAILAGQQNQVGLLQTGLLNHSDVQVAGQSNQLTLMQTGERNRLTVGLNGSNNQLKISQDGGDVVSLAGLTATSANMEVIQKAGQNTLIADGINIPSARSAGGVPNLKIEQTGGANARIQNGPAMGLFNK